MLTWRSTPNAGASRASDAYLKKAMEADPANPDYASSYAFRDGTDRSCENTELRPGRRKNFPDSDRSVPSRRHKMRRSRVGGIGLHGFFQVGVGSIELAPAFGVDRQVSIGLQPSLGLSVTA